MDHEPVRAITVREAAGLLSISERSVWELIRRGELGSVLLLRGARRIPLAEIDRVVRIAQKRPPTGPRRSSESAS